MTAPTQMTAETLNALKGWPAPAALDYEATLDSTVTTRVPPGSVVHVNASGNYALGVTAAGNQMPLFTFQASDDPDVANAGGDAATEAGVWVAINPTGVMMALVATGAYELVSTNFVAANYVLNQMLTAAAVGAAAGSLVGGTLGTDVIVGLVSRIGTAANGTIDNGYGTSALAFWPVFLPVYP
jgi:hypothetical protein